MSARDPHTFVNELEPAAIERLIARLESRAKDAVFARLFDKYAAQLDLPAQAKVLEIGCGTGAMLRFLARRADFTGTAVGVDQCATFIDAAKRFSGQEGIGARVEFQVGDGHELAFPSASFDAVIAHTLISHVAEPTALLREMARLVRPGGTVAVFDGDYASLTYAFPDYEFGRQMDQALVDATFNNPLVMRDLPRLLPQFGLAIKAAWGDAVVEIGKGSYFKTFAETYVPYVKAAQLLPAPATDAWLAFQQQAIEDGTFFAACTYYTYLAQPT